MTGSSPQVLSQLEQLFTKPSEQPSLIRISPHRKRAQLLQPDAVPANSQEDEDER